MRTGGPLQLNHRNGITRLRVVIKFRVPFVADIANSIRTKEFARNERNIDNCIDKTKLSVEICCL